MVFSVIVNAAGKRRARHARSLAPKNKNPHSSRRALSKSKSKVPIFSYNSGNKYTSIGINKRRKIEISATHSSHSSNSTAHSTYPPAQAKKRERDCFEFDGLGLHPKKKCRNDAIGDDDYGDLFSSSDDLFYSSGSSDDEEEDDPHGLKFIQRKRHLSIEGNGTPAQVWKKACIRKDEQPQAEPRIHAAVVVSLFAELIYSFDSISSHHNLTCVRSNSFHYSSQRRLNPQLRLRLRLRKGHIVP